MTRFEAEADLITEQNPFKKIDFNLDLEARRKAFEKKVGGKKVDYEYQEIGLEMQKWFNKNIWFIFYRPEADLDKIKNAFKICREKGKKEINYLLGILKN